MLFRGEELELWGSEFSTISARIDFSKARVSCQTMFNDRRSDYPHGNNGRVVIPHIRATEVSLKERER